MTVSFSPGSALRGDGRSAAALGFLTDQKASCSLYAQASSRKKPTLHSLCTRGLSAEGAVQCTAFTQHVFEY